MSAEGEFTSEMVHLQEQVKQLEQQLILESEPMVATELAAASKEAEAVKAAVENSAPTPVSVKEERQAAAASGKPTPIVTAANEIAMPEETVPLAPTVIATPPIEVAPLVHFREEQPPTVTELTQGEQPINIKVTTEPGGVKVVTKTYAPRPAGYHSLPQSSNEPSTTYGGSSMNTGTYQPALVYSPPQNNAVNGTVGGFPVFNQAAPAPVYQPLYQYPAPTPNFHKAPEYQPIPYSPAPGPATPVPMTPAGIQPAQAFYGTYEGAPSFHNRELTANTDMAAATPAKQDKRPVRRAWGKRVAGCC